MITAAQLQQVVRQRQQHTPTVQLDSVDELRAALWLWADPASTGSWWVGPVKSPAGGFGAMGPAYLVENKYWQFACTYVHDIVFWRLIEDLDATYWTVENALTAMALSPREGEPDDAGKRRLDVIKLRYLQLMPYRMIYRALRCRYDEAKQLLSDAEQLTFELYHLQYQNYLEQQASGSVRPGGRQSQPVPACN